jgi:hypothetical protein
VTRLTNILLAQIPAEPPAAVDLTLLNYGMIAALALLAILVGICVFFLLKLLRREEDMSEKAEREPRERPSKASETALRASELEAILQAIRTLQFNLEQRIEDAAEKNRQELLLILQRELESLRSQLAVCPAAETPPDVSPPPSEAEPAPPAGPPWPDSAREILQKVRNRGFPVAFNSFLGFYEDKEEGPLLAFLEGDGWFMIPNTPRLEDAQAFQDLYSEAFRAEGLMSRGSLFVVRPALLQKNDDKEGRFTLREKGTLSIKH